MPVAAPDGEVVPAAGAVVEPAEGAVAEPAPGEQPEQQQSTWKSTIWRSVMKFEQLK